MGVGRGWGWGWGGGGVGRRWVPEYGGSRRSQVTSESLGPGVPLCRSADGECVTVCVTNTSYIICSRTRRI